MLRDLCHSTCRTSAAGDQGAFGTMGRDRERHLELNQFGNSQRLMRGSQFPPLPSFPPLVVFLIGGDPVGRKSLLCRGYIDLPVTDHITHQPLKLVFRLGIPRFFYASSRLGPEVGWIVGAAKAQ